MSEVRSINDYINEGMVEHIREAYPFFKHFLMRKIYNRWIQNVNALRFNTNRNRLSSDLPIMQNGFEYINSRESELVLFISQLEFEHCFNGDVYHLLEIKQYKTKMTDKTNIVIL